MIERLIEYCARHKAVTIVATLFAVVGAIFAMRGVALDAIPDLSDTQVILYTEWMGRSPDQIEDQVTYPIVTSLLSAPNVKAVRGYSMFGMSFVYVIFNDGVDIYWARNRVVEYLKQIESRLPAGVAPILGPDATSVGWVYQYALVDSSGAHNLAELRSYHDYTLRYALASVPGVAEVATIGGFEKQYQIVVDPDKLRAFGLTLANITGALARSNADVGGRVMELTGREYFVRGRAYLKTLEDIRNISVGRTTSGSPLTIGAVAEVNFGPEIRRGASDLDGHGEAVGGIVVMRQGENALDVIKRVKTKLEEIAPTMPSGVSLRVVYDRSSLIERAITTLKESLIEEIIVVSAVIIIFLMHAASSLVAIIVLPISVLLAFIPMYLFGVNSNIMSLGGIAIAVGAMVDASIVLVENAHKRLEKAGPGANRTDIIIAACKEVGPAVFFAQLIITIGFLPVFGLTGQAGKLFAPLAFTKTFCMFFSALVAVTLSPPLMVMFLRGKIRPEADHPISRFLIKIYKPFVFVALRNPKTTVAIGIAAIIATLPMIPKIGSEFMPPLNEGDLLYMPTTFPGISIGEATRYMRYQDSILGSFPEVLSVYGKAGRAETPTDPAPLSMLETVVRLKPKVEWRAIPQERWYSSWASDGAKKILRPLWPDARTISWQELVAKFDSALSMPGWTNAWTMPIKARIDMLSTGIRTPVGVKIFGSDVAEIERIGEEIEGSLAGIDGLRSVYSDRNTGGYYIDIVPNREKLARYGMTTQDVGDIIEVAIGGMPQLVTVDGRNRFSVNVRFPQRSRGDLDALRNIPVALPALSSTGKQENSGPTNPSSGAGAESGGSMAMSGSGQSGSTPAANQTDGASWRPRSVLPHIPLGDIADIRIVTGPPMLRNENGLLVGYVYVDIDQDKRDIGGFVGEAKERVAKLISLPTGYHLQWTGQFELLEEMAARMRIIIPFTFLLVIVLMYLNFRNLTETFIALASAPFALVGSIWLMYFMGYHYSTATLVGMIALIGLATQTGIVMILYLDHAYERRMKAGKIRNLNDIIWAHMEGTVMRVRPKLMTVATTAIGLTPLLWATGAGADVMKRMAAPMVGGLISSTFLTLEIIPVVYTYWRLAQINKAKKTQATNHKLLS